ncbi:MAG: YggS family pyridoxal phosphate-dependent enzyme [Gammaproteobacteria bacterium]
MEAEIRAAEQHFGRSPGSVKLLAVSKTFPAEIVRAAIACGQRDFGENYVQEFETKAHALRDAAPCWHFIGPLQSNKTRMVSELADWVHSIDRLKIAQRLDDQRPAASPPLDVCLQVNVSGEASKSGVAPGELPALAEAVAALPRLRLRGLMAIPAPRTDFDAQRRQFARLRGLFEDLTGRGFDLDTLSMGMSGDWQAAVAEGATIIRIGTAVFGERAYRHSA